MSYLMNFFKSFLKFAQVAAPIAADVAASTGHNDVVKDIQLAGSTATKVDEAVNQK